VHFSDDPFIWRRVQDSQAHANGLWFMLSKIVQRTTFSPWSESPNLPFVRFLVKPKIMISASFARRL
jgi:hypothetical protein